MSAFFESGFSVREPAWHGLADVYQEYPEDWAQARVWAGLEWDVIESGLTVPAMRNGQLVDGVSDPVEGFKALRRNDTGMVLSVPTKTYGTVTIGQMGDLVEAALDADSNVKFETAGSLKGGKMVWCLVWLDEPFHVLGDESPTLPFLAILNTFDGSGACKIVFTSVRVVCWNTFSAAEAEGDARGSAFSIRHSGNVDERIQEVREGIKELRSQTDATRDLYNDLAQQPIDETQVRTFAEMFLRSPADYGDVVSDRVRDNVNRARATLVRIHDESVTTDGIRGTGYGLLQTATEYLDHVRAYRNVESKMGRSILRPEAAKGRAVGIIRELVS